LIKDFERVCWTGDAHGNLLGNIDKSDPMRSHVSDAMGYFVAQEFALPTAHLTFDSPKAFAAMPVPLKADGCSMCFRQLTG
jgi:hypothetical protein